MPRALLVLGTDPVTGRGLEALLRSAGHDARFVAGSALGRLNGQPAGTEMVVLAPGLRACQRAALLDQVARIPELQRLPVRQLAWGAGGALDVADLDEAS